MTSKAVKLPSIFAVKTPIELYNPGPECDEDSIGL